MSIETKRRVVLSEWRIVMVSQTTYPIIYKVEQMKYPNKYHLPTGYVTLKIPIGSRIVTKWQEQVRPITEDNEEWYIVQEWHEAEL